MHELAPDGLPFGSDIGQPQVAVCGRLLFSLHRPVRFIGPLAFVSTCPACDAPLLVAGPHVSDPVRWVELICAGQCSRDRITFAFEAGCAIAQLPSAADPR